MIITYKTDKAVIKDCGAKFANHYRDAYKNRRFNHLCSDLIAIDAIKGLLEATDRLSIPLDDILSNREKVYKWIDTRPICEFLVTLIPNWVDLSLETVLDHDIVIDKNVDKQIQGITTDFYLFCLWAIWYGADTRSKAVFVNNKATKTLQMTIKKYGHDWIMNRAWCSALAFIILSEKAIEPRFQKMMKYQEERSITSLHSSASTADKCSANTKGYISGFDNLGDLIKGGKR